MYFLLTDLANNDNRITRLSTGSWDGWGSELEVDGLFESGFVAPEDVGAETVAAKNVIIAIVRQVEIDGHHPAKRPAPDDGMLDIARALIERNPAVLLQVNLGPVVLRGFRIESYGIAGNHPGGKILRPA